MLKLKDDKWYVGITTQPVAKRYQQHVRGFGGAAWTREHKPLKVQYTEDLGVCNEERAQLYERRVTRKYMEKYGVNNVRGGDLTSTKDKYKHRLGHFFTEDNWEALLVVTIQSLVILYLLLDKYLVH